jgi:chorismate dehydratase
MLLIGDKVVKRPGSSRLIGYDIETDLGSAWKSLTSLPFVFAVWASPRGLAVEELARRLSRARDLGVQSAEMIAEDMAPGLGWPVQLAKRYLTARLKFTLGPRQRRGLARFLELAREHELVAAGQELVFA